jgi:hypothetical protein
MTRDPGAKGAPHPPADERAQREDVLGLGERERDALLAWVGENLTLVRRTASGQRALYWIFGIALVAGLAAHVGGFLLESSATTEPRSWWPTCSTSSASRCGPVSSWWCSSRSGRRPKGVSTSGPSMLTKQRQTARPGPAVARPRTRRTRGTNDLNQLTVGRSGDALLGDGDRVGAGREHAHKLAPYTRVHFPADRNAFCR